MKSKLKISFRLIKKYLGPIFVRTYHDKHKRKLEQMEEITIFFVISAIYILNPEFKAG